MRKAPHRRGFCRDEIQVGTGRSKKRSIKSIRAAAWSTGSPVRWIHPGDGDTGLYRFPQGEGSGGC